MKRFIFYGLFAVVTLVGFASCSDCKKCHAEVAGVKSQEQELCGDDLKKAKETPGMVCE